jgi:iron-sulfur cluster repair protein YtfE (RIC family)
MTTNSPATIHHGGQVDLTMMLVMHGAFRRDLAHLVRAASRYRTDDPDRHAALLAGWQLFKSALLFHHTGEDADLWPRMRAHLAGCPSDLALLQAMEDEHARIDPLIHAVDGALADLDHGHQRLGDTVDALAGGLSRHLAHEERDTLPLLSRTLTHAEWHGFAADQRRKSGIRGAARLFPWLLDEASPDQARAVLSQLPAPMRAAYRRIWQPRHARHARWEPC